MLFIFFCLRDLPILNDTGHYYGKQYMLLHSSGFDSASIFPKYNPDDHYEYLFQVWARIVGKYIWSDAYAIIFLTSLMVTIANLWLIRKFTPHIGFAVIFLFLFLCFMNSAIRQAYALVLFYFSLKPLTERKYIKYYLIMLVAFFFHKSSWVLLFLPLFMNMKLNVRNISIVLILCAAVSISIYSIFEWVGYGDHFYYVHNSQRERIPYAAILNELFNIFMLIGIWYIYRNYRIRFPERIITWCSILCVTIGLLGIPMQVLSRYALYFEVLLTLQFMYVCFAQRNTANNVPAPNYHGGRTIMFSRTMLFNVFLILNIARIIIVLLVREEWFHLTPYSFYDFEPGLHPFRFGY